MYYRVVFVVVLLTYIFEKGTGHDDEQDALRILKQFHYLGAQHPDPDMRADIMYPRALIMFQMIAGLPITGLLDTATIKRMHQRRCGLPDIVNRASLLKRKRKRRYVLQGSRWTNGRVSYRFINNPSRGGLSQESTRATIDRALKIWEAAADLVITEDPNTSDIEISFVSGNHKDDFPLDGPGETLAHAFYPSHKTWGGDMHFDDDETWTVDGSGGVDLYYVALHELGHSLGLAHSAVTESIMYPWYPEYSPSLQLTSDDVAAVVALYGPKPRSTEPSPTKTPQNDNTTAALREIFCQTGTVDAVVSVNNRLYAFQGELYAVLGPAGIAPGYPRYITNDWPKLENNLDSAQQWQHDGLLLFFKGRWYWRYTLDADNNPVLVRGYPRYIKDDFVGGLPETLDSVFEWSDNGRMYVIKDQQYYRLEQKLDIGPNSLEVAADNWYYNYPQNFPEKWNIHLDQGLADAVQYKGRTFFFSESEYVRYNDNTYKPDPGYPKSIVEHWFGCPASDAPPQDMEFSLLSTETQFDEFLSMERQVTEIPSRGSFIGPGYMCLYLWVAVWWCKGWLILFY